MNDISTPVIHQYNQIKKQYPNYILLFRLGDFYEMFNDDAKLASRVLNIALTKKYAGEGKTIPLAGIPYHSVQSYLAKFIKAGYKVAICEQVEDPKLAKGIVKREVVRVVTPGTIVESDILDDKQNNFLISIAKIKSVWGLAIVDLSTGIFTVTEFSSSTAHSDLLSEINRIQPTEALVLDEGYVKNESTIDTLQHLTLTRLESDYFDERLSRELLLKHFGVQSLAGFGCEELSAGISAASAIIRYLQETQKTVLSHINKISRYTKSDFMFLDYTTQRSLELIRPLHTEAKEGTLLGILDNTITSIGARMLRQWILQPMKNITHIKMHLEACRDIYNNFSLRSGISHILKNVYDLERIITRINVNAANPKDVLSLRLSLEAVPELKKLLCTAESNLLKFIGENINLLPELTSLLQSAIVDNPPYLLREGGIFKDGHSVELDELRSITRDSKQWISTLREQEIARTGINNLKIGFNKVFGYYIEVTNSNLANVPSDYIRKQTLVNAERFITPELKEKEEIILNADEKINALEYELFDKLRNRIAEFTKEIQLIAHNIAMLDCINSLAQAAIIGNYVEPQFNEEGKIDIIEGRHPVLESINMEQSFVPNDAHIDNEKNQILLITGPNMAGKSTYIRQVALITLMAHIGSFVPAKSASICIVDRIFTRVGAMDYLAKGQSTFLVEMNETANILNNATNQSLVILDEIGRGTSTYDGLSIAWSVIEYLHNKKHCNPKTLFATHYHELADLEKHLSQIKNYNVAVLEQEDKIVFLYKIVPGSTDHSYGIYAAQLAGVPEEAIRRAREILFDLECGNTVHIKSISSQKLTDKKKEISEYKIQMSLFDSLTHPALEELRKIKVENLTPLQALNILSDLVEKAK